MRYAYAFLGLLFMIVFMGAYTLFERAEAPVLESQRYESSKEIETMSLSLTSPAFEHNGNIPLKYTCDGENVNPPLKIHNIPEGTASLVLVMDDPDIPDFVKEKMGIEKYNHWALYNLDPGTTELPEGVSTGSTGLNSKNEEAYTGPCPPDKAHRYVFRLYALSGPLSFITSPTLDELEEAAKGTMLERAELIGWYERTGSN